MDPLTRNGGCLSQYPAGAKRKRTGGLPSDDLP
jgi:hypothetical protein